MTTFIDTSVLLDILNESPEHRDWGLDQLNRARVDGPVVVSDIVYSEISTSMETVQDTDAAIDALALQRCSYSHEVLFRAAKAYKKYREENKGQKTGLLPDFLIGALAQVESRPLITRDTGKVRTYFPDVNLIAPPPT